MALRIIPALFHTISLSVMVWGWISLTDLVVPGDWIWSRKGGNLEFLTNQGLWLAMFTMGLSILCDLVPVGQGTLVTLKRSFLMISLPLAVVVTSIYWTLITVLPHLILGGPGASPNAPPPTGEAPMFFRIPWQVDMALHVVPSITLLLDFLLFERKYTEKEVRYVAPVCAILFGVWYAGFVEWCASYNGNFPYPFLNTAFKNRLAVYSGAVSIALVSFRLINASHPGHVELGKEKKIN